MISWLWESKKKSKLELLLQLKPTSCSFQVKEVFEMLTEVERNRKEQDSFPFPVLSPNACYCQSPARKTEIWILFQFQHQVEKDEWEAERWMLLHKQHMQHNGAAARNLMEGDALVGCGRRYGWGIDRDWWWTALNVEKRCSDLNFMRYLQTRRKDRILNHDRIIVIHLCSLNKGIVKR